MVNDENSIVTSIKDYVRKIGGQYSDWYVGIAQNPEDRLFQDHKVHRNGAWIYDNAGSRESAARIEDYFVTRLGTKGNPGGGTDATTWVYAYRIERHTEQ